MILNNTAPFYIGWDTSLRKFLIKASYIPKNLKPGDSSLNNIIKIDQNIKYKDLPPYFSFQSWSPGIENIKKDGL